MDFFKRKCIKGELVIDREFKDYSVNIFNWEIIKINPNKISEIIQYDSDFSFFIYYSKDYKRMNFSNLESFYCFAFGKKIVLLEDLKNLTKHYLKISMNNKLKIEKIIMNNGNEYITLV